MSAMGASEARAARIGYFTQTVVELHQLNVHLMRFVLV
jgi:hypothetical protein